MPESPRVNGSTPSRTVKTYEYQDEAGAVLFGVERREPKTFRQFKPDGKGGREYSVKGVRRVPYRLPRVIAAIAEGKPIHAGLRWL